MVKNLPAVQKTACSGGDVDLISGSGRPLEKEMAIHSSFLPGKSQGQRSLAGYNPWHSNSRTRLSN